MIKIVSPDDEGNVAATATVSGFVDLKNTPVQLYILSNDDKFYLQPPVKFKEDGRSWYGLCYFGNEESKPGEFFVVIAVQSEARPHSPVDAIAATDIADFIVVQRG